VSPAEDQRRLTAALGRVASGLFILSARRGDLETGMLTSWVQQCSFEPPQVSVAVKRGRWLADWLTDGAGFALNVLDDTQTDMIVHFGRGFNQGEPAFRGVPIDRSAEGNPILTEALAFLDCRVAGHCQAGDHDLFIARVVGGRLLGEGHPMVHVRKSGSHY